MSILQDEPAGRKLSKEEFAEFALHTKGVKKTSKGWEYGYYKVTDGERVFCTIGVRRTYEAAVEWLNKPFDIGELQKLKTKCGKTVYARIARVKK